MGWIDPVQGPIEGACEYGNEHSESVKYCEFLE
jgi:hypothetical protein